MAPLNILTFGASRNIGYFAAVRLLGLSILTMVGTYQDSDIVAEKGATVTFLLRSPSIFDSDTTIQEYVRSGHAHLLKGDATREEDVQKAWSRAGEVGAVDAVIFTVGAVPSSFHPLKGFLIKPHNLVTQCILNVLCTMPTHANGEQPKLIAISSLGLTRSGHALLPFTVRALYATIGVPHRDKIAMDRVISHCAGWAWNAERDGAEPTIDLMGEGWTHRKGLPAEGGLKNALIIRAGMLTDGECLADQGKKYRVNEDELKLGGYKISRKDAAHFVVDALARWPEFGDRRVHLAY
ncbi:hypothetical protein C8J57DRAFT_1463501 [Mycena rebaudengoi]|nr:hypothetical protein C8J57DRAFT_1463501 [Mycena rebaudengoi]